MRAVLGVDDAAQRLGADHEHVAEVAGDQQRRAGDEHVDEPGAAGGEVERAAAQAQRLAHERTGVRDGLLGSRGGDDEEVDLVGRDAGVLDRRGPGFDREAGGGLGRFRDAAFADAGALDDPVVGGLDPLLELGVREAPLRDGGPPAGDAGAGHHMAPSLDAGPSS